MKPASEALAQTDPIDMPADWASFVETKKEIPYHTDYYRKRGRPSMKEKAEGQQYFAPPEEKALVAFILRMSAVGTPVCVKYIPALAFCIASYDSLTTFCVSLMQSDRSHLIRLNLYSLA
jgi:hypothetical protein